MDTESLKVDIASPTDVRDKLPRARELARAARAEAEEAVREADRWDRLVNVLASVAAADNEAPAGEPAGESALVKVARTVRNNLEQAASRNQIVEIVEQMNRPMHWKEIADLLPQFKDSTVSWTLSNMEREGMIQRVSRGVYAPLDYVPEQVSLQESGGTKE